MIRLSQFLSNTKQVHHFKPGIRMYKTYPVPEHLKHSLLINKPVQTVHKLFKQHNFKIRIAGGYVRDAGILNLPANDIDLATDATPDEMHEIFRKEEIRTFNVNGEVHGTVSCLIEGETLEITTLRSDVETDGRKAVVEFHRNWAKDAERRDLTIGQLFLDLDDFLIIDHFDGVEHLKNNIVKFVGDADKRIREDYLRILRYFRFLARMTPVEKNIYRDDETLAKIKNNKDGLRQISRERIWTEIKKICVHKSHASSVIKMIVKDCELCDVISLDRLKAEKYDDYCEKFDKIYNLQRKLFMEENGMFSKLNKQYEGSIRYSYKPSSSIVFLCGFDKVADVMAICKALKMSNADKDEAVVVMQYQHDIKEALDEIPIISETDNENQNNVLNLEKQLKRILFRYQKPIVNLKQRILYTIIVTKSLSNTAEEAIAFFEENIDVFENVFYNWDVPRLPLTGHDIKNEISYAAKNPKSLSMFTRICEKAFIDSDLSMEKDELMELCRKNVPDTIK